VAKAMSGKQSIFDRLEKQFAGKNPSLKDGGGKLTKLDQVVTFPSLASLSCPSCVSSSDGGCLAGGAED
jgi:hypothetical protein